jgi:hypothetical protein
MPDRSDLSSNLVVPTEVKALIQALHLKQPQFDGLRSLNDHQWQFLLRFAELAHLTLPLARIGVDGLPTWVTERLRKNLEDNRLRFQRVKNTYAEAVDALQLAQIEHVVIKGFTLSPDFVPSINLRQQSDLDLYCMPKDIARAQAALMAIGYVPDGRMNYKFADHAPTLLRLGDWQWRDNAFDPDMPLSIELHYCLWNSKVSLLQIEELDRFFDRREIREIDGFSVTSLNRIDLIGQLSMHIVRNVLLGDAIVHHLFELASFLDIHSPNDHLWSSWQLQHSESLRRKEVLAFELARQWFGCQLPDVAENMISQLPGLHKQWLRRFTFSSLEGLFRENKDAIWLHWSLLDQPEQKAQLLRRQFLPNTVPNPNIPVAVLSERKIRPTNKPAGRWKHTLQLISYSFLRSVPYFALRIRTLYRAVLWAAQEINAS